MVGVIWGQSFTTIQQVLDWIAESPLNVVTSSPGTTDALPYGTSTTFTQLYVTRFFIFVFTRLRWRISRRHTYNCMWSPHQLYIRGLSTCSTPSGLELIFWEICANRCHGGPPCSAYGAASSFGERQTLAWNQWRIAHPIFSIQATR